MQGPCRLMAQLAASYCLVCASTEAANTSTTRAASAARQLTTMMLSAVPSLSDQFARSGGGTRSRRFSNVFRTYSAARIAGCYKEQRYS